MHHSLDRTSYSDSWNSPILPIFAQNTLLPVLRIAKCVQRGDSDSVLVGLLDNWRERKLYELQFIQVAVGVFM